MAEFVSYTIILQILLYVIIICPLNDVWGLEHGKPMRIHYNEEHIHKKEVPCAVCPRQSRCVPPVQCPAHTRPGSYNPLCHLHTSQVGVCCFTGHAHAAKSDHRPRTASINPDDIRSAHASSRDQLSKWIHHSETLLRNPETTVNITSPSYGHHLSTFTENERADILGRGGLMNLLAAQELKARFVISSDDLTLGLTDHTDGPFCEAPPNCKSPPSRYRSIGGECTNAISRSWGATHTGFERLLPPDYSDDIWAMRTSTSGQPLPSARLVSSRLVLDADHPSPTHSLMFMQFGQFIAHDTSAGVIFRNGNGSAISCCTGDGEDFLPPEFQHFACAPIAAEPDDIFYRQFGHRCLNFVRTQIAPASDCSVGYAKQMNGASHYPDLSHLYGTTVDKFQQLRAPGGLLNTFNDYGRELPPLTEKKECLAQEPGVACFESGDNHGNQIISLTVLHAVFTREHNRLARGLSRLNPSWNEDKVFMESRRILQAEFQHIIYNEWLPLLIGPQIMKTFGLVPSTGYSTAYDPRVNPSLTAEFAVAAMRFGHSIVDGKIMVPSPKRGDIYETISIPEVMFQPTRMRLRHFLDRLLTGLSWQPMQSVDPFVSEGLTRYLFHGGNPFGLDLAAINIQRGRDYGIRSYNHYRRLCGLDPIADFHQFSPNAAQRLSSVYNSPDDIDLWVGGLLEEPVEGGVVGNTFANIIADQFSRLKRGDRYFYEYGPDVNPGSFTPGQLAEIKKVTLSRIVCDNRDGLELVNQAPQAFVRADFEGNEPVPCDSPTIPTMDLSRFREI